MSERSPRLYTYTMTTDSGLAPNPFWGKLTMSACKNAIRRVCREGDWIAGFAGKNIEKEALDNGKNLIFLMQVKEKIKMQKYFDHPDFQNKIPRLKSADPFQRIGDNIFKFEMLKDPEIIEHHYCNNPEKSKEIKGIYVLVAAIFYYFGRRRLEIKDINAHVKVPDRPNHISPEAQDPEVVKKFLAYVKEEHKEMLKIIPAEDFSEEHGVPLPDYWYNGNGTDGRCKNGLYQG